MTLTKLLLGGTEVTRIGLGTNRLTSSGDNVALIREAAASGVGMIDTAHTYTGGQSEETIGSALSTASNGVVVATKAGWTGARPEVIRAEIEESLRRLRMETIPLYYLHRPDPETPLEESLGAIKEYADSGAIRNVGVSNVSVPELERARRVVPIAAVQNLYNLADRTHDDVVDYCAREGIVFVPYFPLRGGGGGSSVAEIAARRAATTAQVALAWLLARSPTMLPIPGTLSREHLHENLAALEIELSADEIRALS
jgi:aryl-alcohol dehydrogenase-like predicted oxidoreductase